MTEDQRSSWRKLPVTPPHTPPHVIPALPEVDVGDPSYAPRKLYPERPIRPELPRLNLPHHHHRRGDLDDLSWLHILGQLDDLVGSCTLVSGASTALQGGRDYPPSVVL